MPAATPSLAFGCGTRGAGAQWMPRRPAVLSSRAPPLGHHLWAADHSLIAVQLGKVGGKGAPVFSEGLHSGSCVRKQKVVKDGRRTYRCCSQPAQAHRPNSIGVLACRLPEYTIPSITAEPSACARPLQEQASHLGPDVDGAAAIHRQQLHGCGAGMPAQRRHPAPAGPLCKQAAAGGRAGVRRGTVMWHNQQVSKPVQGPSVTETP